MVFSFGLSRTPPKFYMVLHSSSGADIACRPGVVQFELQPEFEVVTWHHVVTRIG